MKKTGIVLLISCCLLPATGKSQTSAEWFDQKKTQIKYLTRQIVELQAYLGYVKKGYTIVSSGLNTIRDIKNGEFRLHDLYYTSLGHVNPRIRNSPKAIGIVSHQQYILKACVALKGLLQSDRQLSAPQKDYIAQCISRLLDDVEKVRQELLDLTTDKTFESTDNERLERLNALYDKCKSQFMFIQQFSSEVLTLVESTRREGADERILKELHGLKENYNYEKIFVCLFTGIVITYNHSHSHPCTKTRNCPIAA